MNDVIECLRNKDDKAAYEYAKQIGMEYQQNRINILKEEVTMPQTQQSGCCTHQMIKEINASLSGVEYQDRYLF